MAETVIEAKDVLSVVNKGDRRTVWVMFVAILVVVAILAAFEGLNSKAEAMVDERIESKVTPTLASHSKDLESLHSTMNHIDSSLNTIQLDIASMKQNLKDMERGDYPLPQTRRAIGR